MGGGFATSTELVKRPERSLASVVVLRGHLAPVLPQQAQKTGMLLAPGHPAEGPHSTAADTRPLRPLKAGSRPPSGVADTGPSEGRYCVLVMALVLLSLVVLRFLCCLKQGRHNSGCALKTATLDGLCWGSCVTCLQEWWEVFQPREHPVCGLFRTLFLSSKCAAGCRGPTKQGAQAGVRPEHPGTKRTKSTPERPGKAWTLHPQTQRKPEGH